MPITCQSLLQTHSDAWKKATVHPFLTSCKQGTIQPAQSDYFQMTRGGGTGDYRVLSLAPATVQEAAAPSGASARSSPTIPSAPTPRRPTDALTSGDAGRASRAAIA